MCVKNNKISFYRDILPYCIGLSVTLALVLSIRHASREAENNLSNIYTHLHKPPICSVIENNPDGTPSDFLCKRISVKSSADLWNKIKDYKPTKNDIRATTVQYDEKHITWSKDVIKEDFNP